MRLLLRARSLSDHVYGDDDNDMRQRPYVGHDDDDDDDLSVVAARSLPIDHVGDHEGHDDHGGDGDLT